MSFNSVNLLNTSVESIGDKSINLNYKDLVKDIYSYLKILKQNNIKSEVAILDKIENIINTQNVILDKISKLELKFDELATENNINNLDLEELNNKILNFGNNVDNSIDNNFDISANNYNTINDSKTSSIDDILDSNDIEDTYFNLEDFNITNTDTDTTFINQSCLTNTDNLDDNKLFINLNQNSINDNKLFINLNQNSINDINQNYLDEDNLDDDNHFIKQNNITNDNLSQDIINDIKNNISISNNLNNNSISNNLNNNSISNNLNNNSISNNNIKKRKNILILE